MKRVHEDYVQYGAYMTFDHEPTPEEDLKARKKMARQLSVGIFNNAHVIRKNRTCADSNGNITSNEWTIAMKLIICIRPCPRKVCRLLAQKTTGHTPPRMREGRSRL